MKTFGKYRLLEPLASGGMAEVWRAEVAGPGGFAKEVALKLVRADRAAEPELARLFAQEARLASRLGHGNVVQVFEFDEVDGRPYLAMELVRGKTLRQLTDRCRETGRRLGLARSVHVAAEVARALAYAHRLADGNVPLGVVHRDVSPQNVLISFEGEVKLADFGIARALGAAEHTAPGTVKGKLAYMAPEQARGEPVDGRADLFALGVVLWELCAGRRLFARDSEAATLQALLSGEPIAPPSEWNEQVPPALDRAVLEALERDRERRTPDADRLLAALSAVRLELARRPEDLDLRPLMSELWPGAGSRAPEETTRVRPAGPLPSEAFGPGKEGVEAEGAETRTLTGRWGRRGWALAAGAAVVVVAGGGWWMRGRGGEGSTATPTATPTSTSAPASTATPTLPTGGTSTPTSTPAPTSTPTQTSPPTPSALPEPAASRLPVTPDGRLAAPSSGRIGGLPLPPAASGEGILVVNVNPWARVEVDGIRAGDTPREWRLPAGRHRLRASHPVRGAAEAEFEVRAGERRTWQPRLSR